jgi:hypothetical protein
MPVLPRSILWRRLDRTGTDHALFSERSGFYARGTMMAAGPVPYTCGYELLVDESWVTARLSVTAEGAGWLRGVKLERAAGRWRVTASEQGDLDGALRSSGHPRAGLPGMEDPELLRDALDVDLEFCPLLNTPPVRRHGLLRARPGTSSALTVAFVRVPSLEVLAVQQVYTALGDGRVRFESDSFRADLTLDADGYVVHYPELAERA